ncbi:DedA family protein [Ramlibacter sp.]|uniref:DedA family protein n=1 Tax=Ramlibacter sp. TaxID=1917967 RepID=UPI003D0C361C
MTEWIIELIQRGGYFGVAMLMLLENVFPPIPSELVLPFAGYVAATGELHPAGVWAAAIAGSLAGALPWYWAGRLLGVNGLREFARRHGRWLTLEPHHVDAANAWFRRHGPASVGFGRLVPTVRSVISLPAGVAKMRIHAFLFWSTLGTAAWSALLLGAGYMLQSRYESVQDAVEWIARGVLVLLVGAYLWRVARFGKRKA